MTLSPFWSRDCNALISRESLQPSSRRQRLWLSTRSVLHCLQPLIWDYLKRHDFDAISISMTTTIIHLRFMKIKKITRKQKLTGQPAATESHIANYSKNMLLPTVVTIISTVTLPSMLPVQPRGNEKITYKVEVKADSPRRTMNEWMFPNSPFRISCSY